MTNSIEQSGESWKNWRALGVGSSDVAAILGISPWKTKHRLWLEKTGRVQVADISNQWQVQRGTENEGKARAHFELMDGRSFPPALVVHPKYDFMRVSLDGLCEKTVLEIKVPSMKVIESAALGVVPDYYMAQIQYQMFCVGAESAIFFCMHPESGRAEQVIVKNDFEFQAKIEKEVIEFWNAVKNNVEPELSEKDYVTIKDPEFTSAAESYLRLKAELKDLEASLEAAEIKLKSYTNEHPAVRGAGIKILKYTQKGNVDYAKIPELKGVDLEPYRKKESTRIRITASNDPKQTSK